MAFYQNETKLCFIAIPKTGSHWVRKVLQQKGSLGINGNIHDFPLRWRSGFQHFTVWRDPADWLRSAWNHRVSTGWARDPNGGPWDAWCGITDPYKSNDFDKFALDLCKELPNIVGWLYASYTPPGTQVVLLNDSVYDFLELYGFSPRDVEPVLVSQDLPEIKDEIREMIYLTNMGLPWPM